MKFCEFCGALGAFKTQVEAEDYYGDFYLCAECDKKREMYNLKGKSHCEVLNNDKSLRLSGPKSCAVTRLRNDWSLLGSCDLCHRRLAPIDGGLEFSDDYMIIPPELISSLPKSLKQSYKTYASFHVCPVCRYHIFIRMVNHIPEDQLPLHIRYESFKYSEKDELINYLNDEVRELVSRRLRGESMALLQTLDKPKEFRCFDISLEHLTDKDLELLEKDGEIKPAEEEGYVYADGENPFIIAPYEHGFFIEFHKNNYMAGEIEVEAENYGYSKVFLKILEKAVELGYTCIRFDSTAPKYKI